MNGRSVSVCSLILLIMLFVFAPSDQPHVVANISPSNTQPILCEAYDVNFSTYIGGSASDYSSEVSVGPTGNIVITGRTLSSNFPLVNPIQTENNGSEDIYVVCLTPDGQEVIFSTLLGGSGMDLPRTVGFDSEGNIIVAGATASTNFPTFNAMQPSYAGGALDFFVVKFRPNGSLLFSTYLGGSGSDFGYGIAFDDSNNILLTGHVGSTDFPTVNAMQPTNAGREEAVITKMSADGQSLIWSTYLGGSLDDLGLELAIDTDGNVIVGGLAGSDDFPLQNATQDYFGGQFDAFLTKVSPDGQEIIFSTYYGGDGDDGFWGVATNAQGEIAVAGRMESANLTTIDAIQSNHSGGEDGFVMKFLPNGTPVFATYLGGESKDFAWDADINDESHIVVVGETRDYGFPITQGEGISFGGSSDAFVIEFNETGNMIYGQYFGGSSLEVAHGVEFDNLGGIVVGGYTASDDFSIANAVQDSRSGGSDAFLFRIIPEPLIPSTTITVTSSSTSTTTASTTKLPPPNDLGFLEILVPGVLFGAVIIVVAALIIRRRT
ncbi:MAG: SBBP repeat-containing protein [Candidatus Thorarchaeota archaeon]